MPLFDLFRRQPPSSASVTLPARVEPGVRIYAFGDVHGRLDLLRALFAGIERDKSGSGEHRVVVVGLGDYIDRGPDSRAVVETLHRGIVGCGLVAIRGNHEQMLLDFLDDPANDGPSWTANGAAETLASYGVDVGTSGRLPPLALQAIRDVLLREMPEEHLRFLRALPFSHTSGDYFFAHAGIRPGVSIANQTKRDLLWVRKGFTDQDEPSEKVVVHGHTPMEQPYLGRYRISLDTGAVFSDRLTCIVLDGSTRRLLHV